MENIDFRRLYPTFSGDDVRYYIKELLKALQFSHGKSIMHRAVRPHNIMIDPTQRKVVSISHISGHDMRARIWTETYVMLVTFIQLGLRRGLCAQLTIQRPRGRGVSQSPRAAVKSRKV